jgi:hypothetical protein
METAKAVFYTYVLSRPDGTPFYVGKGSGKRFLSCGNNAAAQSIYNDIVGSGQQVQLCLVPAASESAAFTEEERLIALYGRLDKGTGPLCNLTDGGPIVRGHPHGEITCAHCGRKAVLSRPGGRFCTKNCRVAAFWKRKFGGNSHVASPNGVTLLYEDGSVILLRLVGDGWSAVVVGPDFVRKADHVSANGDWL